MFEFIKTLFGVNAPSKRKSKNEITYQITVQTYEIDAAAHVNNIVYIKWVEEMRVKLINSNVSIKRLMLDQYFPVVGETNIRYKRPIELFEDVTGKMWIDSYAHSVWKINFEFWVDNELSAKGYQKVMLLNMKNNKMEQIDEKFVKKYLLF